VKTLPVVAYAAAQNKGRRDLFFFLFLLLFFFSAKKKRNKRSKRCKKTKTILKTNTQNINTAHTGKGKKSVCKPKADSERNERFRRTGFGSET